MATKVKSNASTFRAKPRVKLRRHTKHKNKHKSTKAYNRQG